MTLCKILLLVLLLYSMDSFSQSDTPKSTNDSVSYADTVWSEVVPVALNLPEVRKMIEYPEEAREDHIEGRVVVKCLIGQDGEVIKTGEITGPAVFYKEIRRVAMFMKFSPGMVNNYPVKVWVSVPFQFNMK